jgi:hypothetical protein
VRWATPNRVVIELRRCGIEWPHEAEIPVLPSLLCWIAGLCVCLRGAAALPLGDGKDDANRAAYTCPAPPEFSRILGLLGYYSDKQYSVIDAKRLVAFNDASEGPTHLGQYATNAADAWLSKGSRAAATCVYSLLDAAAKADAWDDKMPNNSGVYLQNWMLSGTAMAYLKVRGSQRGTPEQDVGFKNGSISSPPASGNTSTCSSGGQEVMPGTIIFTGLASLWRLRASPTTTWTLSSGV